MPGGGENRRELPWRTASGAKPDPYRVWLSEILLQQTTGAAAAPYFLRFIARWPDVAALAAASLDEVIETFAGLGYYARARNLHACAQEIARRGGRFPDTKEELRALPGVGAYTAGAIAAIAFGRQAAAVDGNVARIVARLNALETPVAAARSEIVATAQALVPADRPGDFAEALMDLGAMICRPRAPPMRPMSALVRLCGGRDGRGGSLSAPGAQESPAGPLWRGLFRLSPRRRFSRPSSTAQGAAWGDARIAGAAVANGGGRSGARSRAPPFVADWRRIAGEVGEQVFTHFTLRLTIHVAAIDAAPSDLAELFWVGAEEAPRAGFSSVMLKAIAHAGEPGGAKPTQ